MEVAGGPFAWLKALALVVRESFVQSNRFWWFLARGFALLLGLCLVVGGALAEDHDDDDDDDDHDDDDEEEFGDRFFDDDDFFLAEGFPLIVEHPVGQVVLPGDQVLLFVEAEGDPPLKFQWNRNGEWIEGATESELEIEAARPRDSGVYSVTVYNDVWAVESFPADLVVAAQNAQFADHFDQRSTLSGEGGSVTGTNVGATREFDEPRHGGKAGGKTVWISWIAPREGIATFDTSGSGFDTLLSIYEPDLDDLGEEPEEEGELDRFRRLRVNTWAVRNDHDGDDDDEHDDDDGDEDDDDHDDDDGDEDDDEDDPEFGVGVRPIEDGELADPLPVDELLGIGNLEEVGRDDDSEAFFASLIQFWAEAGRRYEIAIDGFAGASGQVVLNWSLLTADKRLPVILTTPNDRALNFGDPLMLSVDFQTTELVSLQWFKNGQALEGEESATLEIPSFQPEHTGIYRLLIQLDEFQVFTGPIELQINSEGQTDVIARDKLPDAIESALLQSQAVAPPPVVAQGLRKAAAGLSRGFTGSQVFNTILGSKDVNEPLHCGLVGGSSYWFAYEAPEDGLLRVNTEGSEFDTILAVYEIQDPSGGFAGLVSVACDNNSGADGEDSRVQFQVRKGVLYAVVIDGVGGAAGVVRLNYDLANTNLSSINTLSRPRLSVVRSATGGMRLRWSSSEPFEVMVRSKLIGGTWSPLNRERVANGEAWEVQLDGQSPTRFYQLREEQSASSGGTVSQ